MSEPKDELDEGLVRIFVSELNNQMTLIEISASHIDELLHSKDPDNNLFWYHMESLLKALVAMANILWTSNSKSKHKARSRLLRARFLLENDELPDDLRATRNWFEHFDEKLDDWWELSERRNFADRNVMPPAMISGFDTSDYARFFDPTTGELSVFGRSVNTVEMYAFMRSVANKVNTNWRETSAPHHF